jgi:hypothetical protein
LEKNVSDMGRQIREYRQQHTETLAALEQIDSLLVDGTQEPGKRLNECRDLIAKVTGRAS